MFVSCIVTVMMNEMVIGFSHGRGLGWVACEATVVWSSSDAEMSSSDVDGFVCNPSFCDVTTFLWVVCFSEFPVVVSCLSNVTTLLRIVCVSEY